MPKFEVDVMMTVEAENEDKAAEAALDGLDRTVPAEVVAVLELNT